MNVIGKPTEKEVEEMCDSVEVNLPDIKGCGLNKKIKNAEPLLIDFLEKILTYSPQKRLKPF